MIQSCSSNPSHFRNWGALGYTSQRKYIISVAGTQAQPFGAIVCVQPTHRVGVYLRLSSVEPHDFFQSKPHQKPKHRMKPKNRRDSGAV